MALGLDDVGLGVWTSPAGPSGCTVVLPPPETVGCIAVRGQAPGTREAAALAPGATVQHVDAVVLAGGSAFGLASADGVMRWLEVRGRGHPVPGGVVPIVGAAIVLDTAATQPDVRPDAAAGWAACGAASSEDCEGRVGAGAGVLVAKVGGIGHAQPSGQGIAVATDGDLVVGALVVNNAVGEVVAEDGSMLVGSSAPAGASRYPADPEALGRGMEALLAAANTPGAAGDARATTSSRANTVIGCVVTNADLSKAQLHRVADLAHDGIARAVVPAHTSLDGDALFGLATGRVSASVDQVSLLAVRAVAEAARRGPLLARDGRTAAPTGPLSGHPPPGGSPAPGKVGRR